MASCPEDGKPFVTRRDGSRKRRRNLPIPDNIMADVLVYLDASDYISLLHASEAVFVTPLRFHLCSTKSLCLSFLLKKYPNAFQQSQRQQLSVQLLLQSLLGRSPRNQLQHLELSNLRGITGASWFSGLSKIPLVTLDLSNCVRLEHELLRNYLHDCPKTLRHLHLNGCRFVNSDIIDSIQRCHPGLLSLSLGSCSQSINTSDVFRLLRKLTSLKHFDLQGLTNIQDRESADSEACFLDILPDSINSLNLSGSKPLRLVSQDVFETMNTYLNKSLEHIQHLQAGILGVRDGLDALNNEGLNANEMLRVNRRVLTSPPELYIWKNEPTYRLKVQHLVLNGTGHRRSGIFRGTVATFSLGRCLREVHLGGCEGITDWEIQALAVNCGETLTCFQMRAGNIGNSGLESLGKYCRVLAEVDISGCFGISDDGIIALCQNLRRRERNDTRSLSTDDGTGGSSPPTKRSRILRPSLTILRAAALPKLTSKGIVAMAQLKSLIILDIQNCEQVEPSAVFKTVKQLPCLVDVDAKSIGHYGPNSSLALWLRNDPDTPRTLKRVNNRVFHRSEPNIMPRNCCLVRRQSQRLSATVPLAPMYHCVDCNLLPELDRGFCVECLQQCHVGHKTFLGAFTRFSCDCPFGTANAMNICQAINPSNSKQMVVGERIDIK